MSPGAARTSVSRGVGQSHFPHSSITFVCYFRVAYSSQDRAVSRELPFRDTRIVSRDCSYTRTIGARRFRTSHVYHGKGMPRFESLIYGRVLG